MKKKKNTSSIPPYEADEFMIGDEGGNLEYSHVITERIRRIVRNEIKKVLIH